MLTGNVKKISDITENEKIQMYTLMNEFYDNTEYCVFDADLQNKDYAVILVNEDENVRGFTTLKLVEFMLENKDIHGFFSGDTIIHKDDWGSIALFQTWARFCFEFAEKYDEFYWFLICKGYKTYRILPSFWSEFYPCVNKDTPPEMKKIMDAYGELLYPLDYNSLSGVMEYKNVKDKLKVGVADIGEHELKNKHTNFFVKTNPCWMDGNDLACIAKIDKSVLKPRIEKLIFS